MKILLAEDEEQLSRVLKVALTKNGHEVEIADNGQLAVELSQKSAYDVIILDIMMPIKTGLEALKEIRATGNKTHVIMLTAMAEVDDRVNGLDAGADDYLTKPFSLKELLARLRSMERRVDDRFTASVLEYGNMKLDVHEQELVSHNSIRLAGKEAKLLEFLMLNPEKELSSQQIEQHVWEEDDAADAQTVWIYISYLRQKLAAISAKVEISGQKGGSFTLKKVG